MPLNTDNPEEMTPAEDEAFWAAFEADIDKDDGAEAARHLAAGNPIYYREPDTPKGLVIKEYPDGRRKFVYFDLTSAKVCGSLQEIVVSDLAGRNSCEDH